MTTKPKTQIVQIVEEFFRLKGVTEEIPSIVFKRYVRPASEIVEMSDGNLEKALNNVRYISKWAQERKLEWNLDTVIKRWFQIQEEAKKEPKAPVCAKCQKESNSMILYNGDHLCNECLA